MTLRPDLPALLPLEEFCPVSHTDSPADRPAALHPSAARHPARNQIARWAREWLCTPHPELGRSGPMCPFVPAALQKRLLFGAVYERADLDVTKIKAILLQEMERFVALEPVSGNEAQFKALLVIFPNLPGTDGEKLVEIVQEELQLHFVPNGLMVGEFHARPPEKGGLWNTEFRPLYSPIPMLVIRHMVPTDLLFLKDRRELFLEYLKIYGNAVPERFREQFEQAAERHQLPTLRSSGTPQAAPRIMQALEAAAVPYRVHSHDDFEQPIRTPNDFAQALGYPQGRIAKTLFVKFRGTEQHCLLVCGMDKRIDLRAVAPQLGAKRLEMASLDELQRHVGYPPTSVTPIAVAGIPVYIEQSLMQYPSILTGSGVPRVEIEIAPADLLALCAGQILSMG